MDVLLNRSTEDGRLQHIHDFVIAWQLSPSFGHYPQIDSIFHEHGCCCVGRVGNVNDDFQGWVDISDITLLVNHLFVTYEPLPCRESADLSGDDIVDITDVNLLVDHTMVEPVILRKCPE